MNLTDEQMKEILRRIETQLGKMQKRKYEFYYECGLSSALYSNWNTGKAKPSAAMLGKIADYLGTSYEWLVFGKEDKKETATNGDGLNESDDNMAIRQKLQERPEMKTLFDVASDAPASAIYEAISIILKAKEGS